MEKCQSSLLREKASLFEGLEALYNLLEKSLQDIPPIEITTGGIIRAECNAQLAELHTMAKE